MSKNEAQRASNKRSIIRVSQTVNGFTNATPREELDTVMDMLDDYWVQFQAVQVAIEATCGKNEIDMQVIEMVDTEREYQSTKSKMKGLLKRYTDEANQQQGRGQGDQQGHQNPPPQQPQQQQQINNSKLPKLELPQFDGTYIAWTTFKDMFNSMVKNQDGIPDARKLQYLKNSCKEEAGDIVSEYQTIDANFVPAWDALEGRFEHPRMIVSSHLKVLFDQPIITTESAESLRLLLRTTQKCLRSLNLLGGPTDHWDWLLIHIIVVRLDSKTRRYWELTHTTKEMATWDQLVKALENRCNALETEGPSKTEEKSSHVNPSTVSKPIDKKKQQQSSKVLSSSVSSSSCPICAGTHFPSDCKEFLARNYDGRSELASKYSLCFKCLKPNHNFRSCNSKCQKCGRKHHVLMHNPSFDEKKAETPKISSASSVPKQNHVLVSNSQSIGTKKSSSESQVLLSTALVKVRTGYGNWVIARAFLDGGSQSSVITQSCVQQFNLRKTSCNLPVSGIGEVSAGTCNKETKIEVMSCYDSSIKLEINAVIMKRISSDLPNRKFDISKWSYIEGLQLADPKFNEPGQIDILIGAEYYFSLLLDENKIQGPEGHPSAINTIFGWILSGPVVAPLEESNRLKIFTIINEVNLDKSLKRFWEVEEVPQPNAIKSLEDEKCEKHFDETHYRDEEGRFVVKLPFIDNKKEIGESRSMALRRFGYLERRFARDPILHQEYVGVMRELQALNHMRPAKSSDGREHYYMPHHPVIKPSRVTTKMRVVMDATAKSSNGISLNENLRVGPRLQQDLLRILLRFRSFRTVAASDIEKMFRQILVQEEDRRYQKIIWREKTEDPIEEFELTTVTFGTSSAPFLAVKSLQNLAHTTSNISPKAKLSILEDFYMDDLLTGGDSSQDVIIVIREIQDVLKKAQFSLRKWISNDSDVLQSIDKKVRAYDNVGDIPRDESWKALGLHWHPGSDEFDYKINDNVKRLAVTKRTILAVISSLYDPIGFLAPTIIVAKIFLQNLWISKVGWDEPLESEMERQWIRFQKLLPELEEISIPRWIGSFSTRILELHGFCDASVLAYAAVIYARTLNDDGSYIITIVVAKSKVAPIKTLSTPKLELCGAVLLARLMKFAVNSFRLDKVSMFTWCDNTAVLDWLRKSPINWKTFVANRVSEIQTTIPSVDWRYVASKENPADCATRGVDSSELKNHPLWWSGPSWLKLDEKFWPTFTPPESSDAEMEARKSVVLSSSVVKQDDMETLSNKFSSLDKLKLVTAYILGFVDITRKKRKPMQATPNVLDLDGALQFWLKFTQAKYFTSTIKRLKKGKKLKKTDPLISLVPFIGQDGLLRVGGRLVESSLDYDHKHQIILPQKGAITKLIIEQIHKLTLHGGAQLMLNYLRQKYWLIAGRRIFNQFVRKCVKCCRVKGLTSQQIMGNLPASRVNVGRVFLKSGVDYAGPIVVKVPTFNARKYLTVKGYIAVFVCLATKSIHLECVSDQTTQAFLAALKRFTSRRGFCRELVSDNGSNFIGARNELGRLFSLLQDQNHNEVVKKMLVTNGIDWHMNPPEAPHFGGLFEAGVKSVKFHLRRTMDVTPFTFEEWTTILCQIEAILNSRPLTPLSDDINDLQALTPGHFLIGEPLIAIPEPNLEHLKINTLDRYQLMQRKVQEFWRMWSSEYLMTLQQRTKWKSPVDNLKPGQIVTIKDDDLPPTKWLLGRILDVFPGKDSHVRVAKLRVANGKLSSEEVKKLKSNGFHIDNIGSAKLQTIGGTLERPIHKICVLPVDDDEF